MGIRIFSIVTFLSALLTVIIINTGYGSGTKTPLYFSGATLFLALITLFIPSKEKNKNDIVEKGDEESEIIKQTEKKAVDESREIGLPALGMGYRRDEQIKFEDVIDNILDTTLKLIHAHLSCFTTAVFFPSDDGGYKIRKYLTDGDSINKDAIIYPGVGVIGGHIKDGLKKIDLKEVLSDSKTLYYYSKDAGIRSVLLAPLVADNTTRGFIIADSTEVKKFTDENYAYLAASADLLSKAAFYSYLYNQHRLDHERLWAMRNTEKYFFEKQDMDDVLDKLAEIIPFAFRCNRLTISMLDDTGKAKINRVWGDDTKSFKDLEFEVNEKTLAGILYSKNLCFYRNFSETKYEHRYTMEEAESHKFGSFMTYPIGVDSCKGMILIESKYKDAYNESNKELLGTLVSSVSIAIEKIMLLKQTENLAIRDGLTGLYNHRQFQTILKNSITRTLRYQKPLSLVICDIDFFKKVNDTYGHRFGDEVLIAVAEKLESSIREGVDSCARYGGEEFTIILGDHDGKGAFETVDRIRKNIAALPFTTPNGKDFKVTMSFGIAVYGKHAKKQELLIACADKALYKAKDNGRNRVELYYNDKEEDFKETVEKES